jgi:hypothetical protein
MKCGPEENREADAWPQVFCRGLAAAGLAAVHKDPSDFGISDQDACQGSELAYQGPEVKPLALAAHGSRRALRRLTTTLDPKNAPDGADSITRPPQPSHLGWFNGANAEVRQQA